MRILFRDLFTFIIKDNQTKMESFISIRPPSPLTRLLTPIQKAMILGCHGAMVQSFRVSMMVQSSRIKDQSTKFNQSIIQSISQS